MNVIHDHVDALRLQGGDEAVERHDLVGDLGDPQPSLRILHDPDVRPPVLVGGGILVGPRGIGNDAERDAFPNRFLVRSISAREVDAGDRTGRAVLIDRRREGESHEDADKDERQGERRHPANHAHAPPSL